MLMINIPSQSIRDKIIGEECFSKYGMYAICLSLAVPV